jgi:hypothetical protein
LQANNGGTFIINTSHKLTLTQAGNVGIGTNAPASMLTLNGTTPFIRIERSGVPTWQIQNNTIVSDAGFSINNLTNAATPFFINGTTNNVGIGTGAPESKLHVAGTSSGSDVTLYIDNTAGSALNNSTRLKFSSDLGSSVSNGGAELNCIIVDAGDGAVDLVIKSYTGASYTEKARFLAGGGITFNGDTLQVNALDDYEEGTWTLGLSFGGGTTGIAYSANSGTYTKIGRQVTVNGYIALSSKGSSAGSVAITGLPFPIPSTSPYYAPPSLWLNNVSFANQFIGYTQLSTSQIRLNELTEAGVFSDLTDGNFANNSEIMVSMTYFV